MKRKILLLTLLITSISLFAENRVALLIANGKYKNFSSLAGPTIEAEALSATLMNLGFDVKLLENATREQMLDELDNLKNRVNGKGGIAFFHYGGHGVQVNGSNYLIPVDADIPDERKVATRAVDINEVMSSLDSCGSDTNIVILDACRNNPLPAGAGRSASRGLSVVGVKPKNSIIVYSAEAGTVAQDGLFTPTLTRLITSNNISLTKILMQLRKEVSQKTNGSQIPGEYNQLFDDVYLAGKAEEVNYSNSNNIQLVDYYDLLSSIKNSKIDLVLNRSIQKNGRSKNVGFYFSGINDFIKGKMDTNFPISNNPRTISLWVKQLSLSKGGNILFCYGNPKNTETFGITYTKDDKSGKPYILVFTWGLDKGFWCDDLINSWANITVTFDRVNTKVYVNGKKIGETDMSSINTSMNYFVICSNMLQDWNQFTNAIVDDVRIYNRALSDTEIINIAK